MASNMQTVGKKIQGSTSDRISHLPANVMDKILTCMPVRDAVRTSILSRKWRYAWVTLPELVFDDRFCLGLGRPPAYNLLMVVYQVLLLHRGPILKLKLCLPIIPGSPEIDQLLLFVSNNGIEELVLNIGEDELYKLPSSIFSCEQMKHLELNFCLFKPPPSFKGFRKLLSLDLRSVDISFEVFSSLISSCPLLEKLKLVDCPGINDLEISAPKLKCLFFEGEFISSICFKNSPNLARVSLYCRESMTCETSEWDSFFADLPVVEFLELGDGCLESIFAGGVPRRLPSVLSHMKILKLYLDLDEVPSMLCLVRSSPNLKKIEIWLPPTSHEIEYEESLEGPLDLQGWADISLDQLKEVELRDGRCTRFELELVKLVLAKSPILEKMVIVLDDLIQGLESKFLEEVKGLKPLSPLAKVSCKLPSWY
ncbi:F-box/FBD/LRR-repeat protein At1g13570-like [Diospyros lotus]|uniref:F-box/FBD/LRR-repeat protein At1g13570-like n=1 Tax=Diospyros lotus TaxID=55363 RepID=UPI0022509550|nr:F-box/FBD/LRR-repeat protein At1g13570-like [Diospyros lotus]